MKVKLFSFLFLWSSFALGQKPFFHIRYSEPFAVFVFVQHLATTQPSNVFKTTFQTSEFYNEKYRELIREFEELNIDYGYDFEEFPYGSKTPMQTRDILQK